MVADKSSNNTSKPARGASGTLAYLCRIGTYLWIGLVNPGPPSYEPRTVALGVGLAVWH